MGRGCITYSISFIAGILAGNFVSPNFFICSSILAISIPLIILIKKYATTFIAISHIALFIAGMQASAISSERENLPLPGHTAAILSKAELLQDMAGNYLKRITSTPEAHSTLCALTIGIKENMPSSLKKAYSQAGAMHLLALSGMHAGIIYIIFDSLLLPLAIIPGSIILRFIISTAFLITYMVVSGCSPSVVRACTMIFLYKVSAKKFRDIRNWDAIALSALITGAIAPEQVTGIGFQLSYSAVIGIALLYPVCRKSFTQLAGELGLANGIAYRGALKIWESISISLCCQLATLPFILYHFGESAPFFLITNLVAIPLVTCILYLAVMAILLQWVPFLGPIVTECLNLSISALNCFIQFISD